MRRKHIRSDVSTFDDVRNSLERLNYSQPEWWVTDVQTAAFTAEVGQLVRCDPSGGAFTVTFPKIFPSNKGRMIAVKNTTTSANQITIAAATGDTVETGSNIAVGYGKQVWVSDGDSSWMILSAT